MEDRREEAEKKGEEITVLVSYMKSSLGTV